MLEEAYETLLFRSQFEVSAIKESAALLYSDIRGCEILTERLSLMDKELSHANALVAQKQLECSVILKQVP